MLKFIFGFLMIFASSSALADLDCNKIPMHQSTVAKCIFRTIIVKGIPNDHPLVVELHKQAQDLQMAGLTNSTEYSALFVGGSNDALTYIVSVDFYSVRGSQTTFRSVAAVMTAHQQGNAEIKKIFTQEELEQWLK